MGKMNENGHQLLELCTYHDLCIANSYFRTKPQHKVPWKHPRSKHWDQLHLILFRRATLKNVLHTRSYHSADCNTDHSLVCCKIRLQPKRFHRIKKQGKARIDVSKMSQPNLMSQFAEAFEGEFGAPQPKDSATEKWEIIRDTMHRTALATFGKKTSKTHDWFDAKSTGMRPVIEAKRTTLIEYKHLTVTQRKEPADSQSCLEQGSTNREAMCERVLDTAQPGYTNSRHNREHQGNV